MSYLIKYMNYNKKIHLISWTPFLKCIIKWGNKQILITFFYLTKDKFWWIHLDLNLTRPKKVFTFTGENYNKQNYHFEVFRHLFGLNFSFLPWCFFNKTLTLFEIVVSVKLLYCKLLRNLLHKSKFRQRLFFRSGLKSSKLQKDLNST